MSKCVNENCNKDPMNSYKPVLWGCDGDFCCSQECYDKAREQMNYFCSVTLNDDNLFNKWMEK